MRFFIIVLALLLSLFAKEEKTLQIAPLLQESNKFSTPTTESGIFTIQPNNINLLPNKIPQTSTVVSKQNELVKDDKNKAISSNKQIFAVFDAASLSKASPANTMRPTLIQQPTLSKITLPSGMVFTKKNTISSGNLR